MKKLLVGLLMVLLLYSISIAKVIYSEQAGSSGYSYSAETTGDRENYLWHFPPLLGGDAQVICLRRISYPYPLNVYYDDGTIARIRAVGKHKVKVILEGGSDDSITTYDSSTIYKMFWATQRDSRARK